MRKDFGPWILLKMIERRGGAAADFLARETVWEIGAFGVDLTEGQPGGFYVKSTEGLLNLRKAPNL